MKLNDPAHGCFPEVTQTFDVMFATGQGPKTPVEAIDEAIAAVRSAMVAVRKQLNSMAETDHRAGAAMLRIDDVDARIAATAPLQDLADAALARASARPLANSPISKATSLDEVLHALAADVARMTGTADPFAIIALLAARLAGYAAPHRRRNLRDAMLAQMGDVE